MYPLSQFPTPYGSYRTPVDIPSPGPFDDPVYQVCINRDWLPFVAGSLKQLLLQSTWNFMSEADLQDVQGRVFDLISAFGQVNLGCGTPVPSKMCLSGTFADADYGFSPDSGMVCTNPYVIGSGFVSCDDGSGNQIINVGRHFTGSTSIESYSFTFNSPGSIAGVDISIQWSDGGSVVRTDTTTVFGFSRTVSSSTPVTADAVDIHVQYSTTPNGNPITLADWSMCYDGVFPLSTPPEAFVHVFDFTVSDGGANVGSVPFGSYSAGVGWVSAVDGSPSFSQLRVWINPNAAFVCTSLELTWSFVDAVGGDADVLRGFSGFESGSVLMDNSSVYGDHASASNVLTTAAGPQTIRSVLFGTDAYTSGSGSLTVTRLVVRGKGIDPFS